MNALEQQTSHAIEQAASQASSDVFAEEDILGSPSWDFDSASGSNPAAEREQDAGTNGHSHRWACSATISLGCTQGDVPK